MVPTTQADASAKTKAVVLPPGMMLPVQALTAGFVHEVLPSLLHTPQIMQLTQAAALPSLPLAAAVFAAGQGAGAEQTLLAEPAGAAGQMASAQMDGVAMSLGAGSVPTSATTLAPASMPPAAVPAAMPVAGMVQLGGASGLSPSTVADDAHSRQGVRIGDVGVMLTYEDSSELTDMPELYYLPNAPVWVKGLANLHGNLVPVFDIAQYLGVQSSDQSAGRVAGARKPMLLVLGHGADAAGVVIEGIPQRLVPTPLQQTDVDTAPALLMPHIQGAYFINDHLWFDLDCSSLLNMLEEAMMHHA